jgi:outer membrane protein assembly factor BamB
MPAPAPAWPLFHGDVARSGHSDAPPVLRPKVRWKARVGIQSWLNSPVVAGSLVVVGSSGDRWNKPDARDGVHALRLEDGKRVWHAHLPDDANGVAVAGGRVIATCDDGHAYALDLESGKVLWKLRGEGKMYTHPLVVGDLVVVGDASGILRGLALSDGARRWQVKLEGPIRGGAAADEERIYAASQGGEVVAVKPSGKVAWRATGLRSGFEGGLVPIVAYAAPLVVDDLVIVPFARDTTYGEPAFLGFEAASGEVRWRASGSGTWANVRATPAYAAGLLVYAEAYSGDIVGITASDGRVSWRRTVGPCLFPQWAAPVASGALVHVPRSDGSVYAVRAENGEVVWRLYLGDADRVEIEIKPPLVAGAGQCEWKPATGEPLFSSPAISPDGTLLVGTGQGWLFAIEDAGEE